VAEATAAEIPTGSTIRNIAAALRIRTELLLTDSGGRRGAILLRTARLAPGNSLADRAAPCLAIGLAAQAIEQVAAVLAIAPAAESVPAIEPTAVEQIA
jgi:hypothetical protein